MDSSAVYALFEELKQKIDELNQRARHNTNSQTDSTSDSEVLISLIEDLQISINQQQFTPEQIKNLGQISAYSINKINENVSKVLSELKVTINPIDEKINQIKSQQNVIIRNEHVFSFDFRNSSSFNDDHDGVSHFTFFWQDIWLLDKTNQLKDNDLKYRYIKSINVITPENIYKLENIFKNPRDKERIRETK